MASTPRSTFCKVCFIWLSSSPARSFSHGSFAASSFPPNLPSVGFIRAATSYHMIRIFFHQSAHRTRTTQTAKTTAERTTSQMEAKARPINSYLKNVRWRRSQSCLPPQLGLAQQQQRNAPTRPRKQRKPSIDFPFPTQDHQQQKTLAPAHVHEMNNANFTQNT